MAANGLTVAFVTGRRARQAAHTYGFRGSLNSPQPSGPANRRTW